MVFWKNDVVKLDDATLHCRRVGSGPSIVLAHGMTDNAVCWDRLAMRLAESYEVIAYDARGHGRSSPPRLVEPRDTAVADLMQLMRLLRLDCPVLLGHSMGAVTVALAAGRAPTLVRAVVMEDPPMPLVSGDESSAPPLERPSWIAWKRAVEAQRNLPSEEVERACRATRPGWHEEDLKGWVTAQQQVDPAIFDVTHPMHTEWTVGLENANCPYLLIAGERRLGSLVGPGEADKLRRTWKNGEFLRIPGAGHCVRRDRFELFYTAVSRFLLRV